MDIVIEKARPEDAAELLTLLSTIGGESDILTFGSEGLPITAEEEVAYLRSLEHSTSSVMFVAKTYCFS